jgi:hypothetical protein
MGRPGLIDGPFALLLGASTDLGPSHRDDTQLTAALRDATQPQDLVGWAHEQGLSVHWRPGDNWAIVEGNAENVASAFDVEVHDSNQPGRHTNPHPQHRPLTQRLRLRAGHERLQHVIQCCPSTDSNEAKHAQTLGRNSDSPRSVSSYSPFA